MRPTPTLSSALTRRALLAAAAASTQLFAAPQHALATEVEANKAYIGATSTLLPAEGGDSVLDAISWKAPKERGLSTEKMAARLDAGLREREWFVTGRGLPELFSDNFKFSDPDVSVDGIEPYCRQVRRLFDQSTARCEVVCCEATAENTITIVWRNSGRVALGPGLELKPYVVTTTLRTDPADGLIVSQVDAFEVNGPALLLYQVPALRRFSGPDAPPVEELRKQCSCSYRCVTTA